MEHNNLYKSHVVVKLLDLGFQFLLLPCILLWKACFSRICVQFNWFVEILDYTCKLVNEFRWLQFSLVLIFFTYNECVGVDWLQ